MGERIVFNQTQEQLELPEGVSKADFSRALDFREWTLLRIKVLGGYASQDEKVRFEAMPTIAGRPAFVSTLNENEQQGLNLALTFVNQVENDPNSYFKPLPPESQTGV